MVMQDNSKSGHLDLEIPGPSHVDRYKLSGDDASVLAVAVRK